eukprot:m51a1_g5228 hypothetical protein (335) ;mRNA; r:281373-282518
MRVCVLAVLFLSAIVAESKTISEFRSWALLHGKRYTAAEEARRFQTWTSASAEVAKLNKDAANGALFTINGPFADLTRDEFRQKMLSTIMIPSAALAGPAAESAPVVRAATAVPAAMDMRSWFPAIKNQGSCGSCWAFSAAGTAEGVWFRKTSKVISLSEQQLVNCDKLNANGCNGGSPYYAFVWMNVYNSGGLTGSTDLPYTSGLNGAVPACSATKYPNRATFTSSKLFGAVPSDNLVMTYLQQYGPISVAVAADQFQYYQSGVLDTPLCKNTMSALNHGVILVGYGVDPVTRKQYWLVRNSWGTLWGEAGYIRIARGKNMCGINLLLSTIVA